MSVQPFSYGPQPYLRLRKTPAPARFTDMSAAELTEAIESRLRCEVRDPYTRPVMSRGERWEDVIITEFRMLAKEEHQGRFRDAVRQLVCEWFVDDRNQSRADGDYLPRILRLCEHLEVRTAEEYLFPLTRGRLQGLPSPYDFDLHAQLLRVLQNLQERSDDAGRRFYRALWIGQLAVPKYAAIAFRGLYLLAPEEAAANFHSVLSAGRTHPEHVDPLGVALFLVKCASDHVLVAIAEKLKHESRALQRDFKELVPRLNPPQWVTTQVENILGASDRPPGYLGKPLLTTRAVVLNDYGAAQTTARGTSWDLRVETDILEEYFKDWAFMPDPAQTVITEFKNMLGALQHPPGTIRTALVSTRPAVNYNYDAAYTTTGKVSLDSRVASDVLEFTTSEKPRL